MRKKFIRCFTILVFVFVIILFAASCSKSGSSYEKDYSPEYNSGDSQESSNNFGTATSGNQTTNETRKIIQTVTLDIDVTNIDTAYSELLKNTLAIEGYEYERDVTKYQGYSEMVITLKIPAKKLSEFINQAGNLGNVNSNTLKSEDITDDYFDHKIRLETLEKTLEKYYEFLENAKTLSDQTDILSKINSTINDIERIKGQMTQWDNQVTYATVTIYMYQYADPSKAPREIKWSSLSWDDMWYLTKRGFTSVTSVVITTVQWLIIIFVSCAILILPGLVVIFLLVKRHKKIKKKREEMNKQFLNRNVVNSNPGNTNSANTITENSNNKPE